ncbi:MAG: SycD/LcrH family type III secretion system chaperone [Chlamydiales bacterium]|nr:SycD/LcrH family type III secretion system chaperone [Chlamydiales bacterium]
MSDLNQQIQDALKALTEGGGNEKLVELLRKVGKNIIKGGLPPLQALGLPASALESYYKRAYQLYNSGQYQEAIKIFRVMTMLCPYEHKYVFALAACHHRAGEYVTALAAYQTSTQSDPTDPLPYYHAADCMINLGYVHAARESLKIAIENTKSNPRYDAIRDRASMALNKLESGDKSVSMDGMPTENAA